MGKNFNSMRLLEKKTENGNGMDIYLVTGSGDMEYLVTRRHNKHLENLFAGAGIRVEDLRKSKHQVASSITMKGRQYFRGQIIGREKCRRNRSRKFDNSVEHILKVLKDFVLYEYVDTKRAYILA